MRAMCTAASTEFQLSPGAEAGCARMVEQVYERLAAFQLSPGAEAGCAS